MLKRFLPLCLALVAFGCDSPPEPTAQTKPKSTTTTTKPDTAKPITPPAKPVSNPNRLYQLEDLAKTDVTANGHTLHCWIMDTDPKRQEGLMFVEDKDIKADEGMLFVFAHNEAATHGFWMHNTLIPLDIVYIDSKKNVVFIAKGEKLNDKTLEPGKEFQYVIELKQGQSEQNGIKIGSTVQFSSKITAQD